VEAGAGKNIGEHEAELGEQDDDHEALGAPIDCVHQRVPGDRLRIAGRNLLCRCAHGFSVRWPTTQTIRGGSVRGELVHGGDWCAGERSGAGGLWLLLEILSASPRGFQVLLIAHRGNAVVRAPSELGMRDASRLRSSDTEHPPTVMDTDPHTAGDRRRRMHRLIASDSAGASRAAAASCRRRDRPSRA
jgi:hypothetical protein